MLGKDTKSDIINKFAKSDKDTGSSEVQIALISERISQIAKHLKLFPKDKHSRFGLVKLVGKRRVFYRYLKKNDKIGYETVMQRLKENGYI